MRLHIQNQENRTVFDLTAVQWRDAIGRNPDMAGIRATVGSTEEEFKLALREIEVLVTWIPIMKKHFQSGVLPDAAPRLRMIYCTSAGVDGLVPFDWLPDNVVLLNNSGIHTDKAGEFVLMALLMLQNCMPALIENQKVGRWKQLHGSTLQGRTLCIVGVGALGSGVARQAKAFGMRVIGVRNNDFSHPFCDEIVLTDDIDTILPRVDDVVLACPLTPRTRNLLSRNRIALLPHGARVVNIARAEVWDQDAICDALEIGQLDSALTDVAVSEPLDPANRLWRTRGMIVTPHISADDPQRYGGQTLDTLLANLRAGRQGKPLPNRVDTIAGY